MEDVGEAIGDAAEETWNGIMTVSGYCCYGLSKAFSFFGLSGLAKGERWLSKQYLHLAGTRIKPNIDDMDLRRPFSENNYRENLEIYTQRAGVGLEVHHILPQQCISDFDRAGMNIHSPLYCTWVTPEQHTAIHNSGYNQRWIDFFKMTPNATETQILNFADELAGEYGFEVYYNG